MAWTWIFQCKEASITRGLTIGRDYPGLTRAQRDVARATGTYLRCMEQFGTGRMWVSDEDVRPLTEADVPRYMREDMEVL